MTSPTLSLFQFQHSRVMTSLHLNIYSDWLLDIMSPPNREVNKMASLTRNWCTTSLVVSMHASFSDQNGDLTRSKWSTDFRKHKLIRITGPIGTILQSARTYSDKVSVLVFSNYL